MFRFSPTSVCVHPTHWCTATSFFKRHGNLEQFEAEARLLRIAHEAGCAPEFSADPATLTITMARPTPLTDRLPRVGAPRRAELASEVLGLIRRLHAAGVCHRDLKIDEIVVDGDGRLLLVDFELRTEVEPSGGCYDLIGLASGIAAPIIHPQVDVPEGVWWDAPYSSARRSHFGPLTDVLARKERAGWGYD